MEFDLDVFLDQAAQIPQEHIYQALRAVTGRKTELDHLPAIWAARNAEATAFHARTNPDEVDGVPVWAEPFSDFSAYPSGWTVHHAGTVWTNNGQDVALGEPGTDPAWTPHHTEEESEAEA